MKALGFGRLLFVGVAGILAVLGTASWVLLGNSERFREARESVARTRVLLSAIDAVMIDVLSAESGARDYAGAGAESFLVPYEEARRDLVRSLSTIRTLTGGNPRLAGRSVELEALVAERMALASDLVEARRTGGAVGALAFQETGKGREAMDRVRAVVEEMRGVEEGLLASRIADRERAESLAQASLLALLGAVVLLLGGMLLLLRSELSRRAAAEEALRGAKEMAEAANRELEAFSYSVSHDLRAPLRGMDGFSQAILEDQADRLDERGRDYLRRIRAGAQRMGRLIDDLIELSRISRTELARTRVDLSAMVGSVLDGLRAADGERKVEARVQAGVVADGDPRLLRLLFENLLGNAWKYTGRKPEARIEFGEGTAEGERAFFVRDDGAGFDMQYAGKLFSPFKRLHSKEEFPGTGIGLATVKRIVHRHRGRIWAEAEAGRGAAFHFTLGEGGAA